MPIVTNVVEIVIQGTYPSTGSGTRNIFNIFHYQYLSGTFETAKVVSDFFVASTWLDIAANLSIDYSGVASLSRYLDDVTIQYDTGSVPANGGIALPRLPGDLAIVTPLRAKDRGRTWRGSKHFGPVATASVLKDELTAAAVTAWGTALTAMNGNILTTGGGLYTPVVLSRKLSQLHSNPTTLNASVIKTVLLNKTIGTMRRRKERTVR